uniref:AAA+ ATPase domain-containing protein n=1 Tax=Strongyloides stercoralis TaxID=6248 RepID=A0A0K0DUX8_STRER
MTTLGVFPTIKRSTKLSQLSFHKELNNTLHNIVQGQDFGHLLFYGPPGGGKRTRIRSLLKGVYEDSVSTVKIEKREFAPPTGKKVGYSILTSNCHIELTASSLGSADKMIVQHVIKEMAQCKQLNETKQKSFKVVVIFEADSLTKDAQHALRRTMEKYSHNCRIIMCVDCLGRIIDPLKSRCLTIRVPSPTDSEMREALCEVIKKERTSCINDEHIELCINKANGNMRNALITLQTLMQQKGEKNIVPQSYVQIVNDIAQIIATRQSKSGILDCRKKFSELLERCIDPPTIYKMLVTQLTCLIPEKIHSIIWDLALESEGRCIVGSKPIFSLECFVTQAMHQIYSTK